MSRFEVVTENGNYPTYEIETAHKMLVSFLKRKIQASIIFVNYENKTNEI